MKEQLGPTNALYPTPTVLVGATVDGRANFITVAHIGIMTHHHISVGLGKIHYTNAGIHENRTFSVCLPPAELVVETDYCGIMTGKKTDKAALFDVFYGQLQSAPMIGQCPVCMECRLDRVIDFPTHEVFVGEIVQTHADPALLAAKGSLFLTRPSLMHYTARREDLLAHAGDLFAAVLAGAVRATIRQEYRLRDAAQAHRDLEGRKTTGSSILLP